MRVTDMATGGSAISYAEFEEALRYVPAVQPSVVQEVEETPSTSAQEDDEEEEREEKAGSPPFGGLSAAVLRGCVGDFYRAVEGVTNILTDVEFTLPQIVVIGQESSGKSSVLESLAMLPLFPRDSDICTRLPILLKMRHMSHGNVEVEGDPELMPHCGNMQPGEQQQPQLKMKLIYSDGREPVVSDRNFIPAEAAQLMRTWMEQIVKEEHEDKKLNGVVDHVLEIEVRSPNVPNLNIVDLPGIVAGKLIDEPDDMMHRTRALVEKYLQTPHTLVLAVIPAFERVRNSQAFQLVQQYNLMDKTIGVLTMVDRAMDETNPEGPLADVMSRLDGTSQDIVYLKQGYVVVRNRDTRSAHEMPLARFKEKENAWLEKNLPGYIDRGLASSTALVTKLEKMLADHIQATWVPQTLSKIETHSKKTEKELARFGPDGQGIVEDFYGVSPLSARKRMFQLLKPILPEILGEIDEEMLRLAALVHAEFLQSREEHELILSPFEAKKKQNSFASSVGSLVAASMVMLDSHEVYIADHFVQILKNVVLHIVNLVQKIIATPTKSEPKGTTSQRLDRFANLHYFFAGMLWERLNELLIDEEGLLQSLEKTFLEFDPQNASILQIPTQIKATSPKTADSLTKLASELELYLDSKGFQNTSLGEVYLPQKTSAMTSLSRDTSRLIVSAQVPTLTKSNPHGFGAANPVPGKGGFSVGSSFTSNGFTFSGTTGSQESKDEFQEVDEFESRLFFAMSSHVVAPLLQSICDMSNLTRKMQEYVSCFPKVTACKTHIFRESTSDKRKKLKKFAKRLDVAAAGLKANF